MGNMSTDDITYPSYECFPQEEEGISSHRVKMPVLPLKYFITNVLQHINFRNVRMFHF